MANITLVEAVSLALAYELEKDKDVVVLGEDVGINGGVFRATAGLAQRFGEDRVIDTPLAEAMIAGLTIGMATQGMKPVAEAQFMGFIFPMVEHIVCHAARPAGTNGLKTDRNSLRPNRWTTLPRTRRI